MSFKRFVQSMCVILILFLVLHLILYGFTKETIHLSDIVMKRSSFTGRCEPLKQVEVTTIGDLARLSYLFRLGVYRTVVDTSDIMGYLNKEYDVNTPFPVVTVGDSFMWYNGDDKRFTSILKNKLNVDCYNMSANGVEDPFTFLQSDLKKDAKILVWEAAERNISADTFHPKNIDFYYTESKKKIEHIDNWDHRETFSKQLRTINLSNLKFLINNVSYALSGKPPIGKVGIVKLKDGKNLMFYEDDLTSFKRQNFSTDLEHSVEFISHINKELKNCGITLIFFAVPDKYSAYYEEIFEEEKIKNDARFIEHLTSELQKKDVIAINLIEPFRNKIRQGSDLYHFDDTHWNGDGAEIAAELAAKEIQKRGLLD